MRYLLFILVSFCSMTFASAQQPQKATQAGAATPDSVQAPYLQYPTLPAFNILGMDSATIFNTFNIPKGRKTAIVLFSPDCSHCRRLTNRIIDSMSMLTSLDFYFVTPVHNMAEIRKFYEEHHFADHKNIKMTGRDYEFFFGTFYKVRMVPDIVFYDEQKKLITLFEGEPPVLKIIEAIQ